MNRSFRTRRHFVRHLLAVGTLLVAALVPNQIASASSAAQPSKAKPTVVLVHGAWADSGSWDGVVPRLQHDGYTVDVLANPLRSLAGDSAYLTTFLETIAGPIVLVGHSYGGAVITDAATGNDNVKALVYVDGFAPAEGENVLQLSGPDSALANPDPTQVFNFVPNVSPPTATTDVYVKPSVFPGAFANDLPAKQGAALAATQRPITFGALNELSSAPAWESIPSWYFAGTRDKVLPKAQQLFMAHRAHSQIVQVRASHLGLISQPKAVTQLIETAARATK